MAFAFHDLERADDAFGEAVIHILFEVEVRLFYFSDVDSLGGNDHVSRNICSESKLVSLLEFLKVCQEFVLASM